MTAEIIVGTAHGGTETDSPFVGFTDFVRGSTPLSVVNGGTGSTTQALALVSLGLPSPVGQINKILQSDGTVFALVDPNPGDITAILPGNGITVTGTSGDVIVGIENSGVTADLYNYPTNLAVNLQGQITGVVAGSPPVMSVTGTGNIASTGGATPQISLTGIVPLGNGGTGTDLSTAPLGTLFYAGGAGALVAIPTPAALTGESYTLGFSYGDTVPSWKIVTG